MSRVTLKVILLMNMSSTLEMLEESGVCCVFQLLDLPSTENKSFDPVAMTITTQEGLCFYATEHYKVSIHLHIIKFLASLLVSMCGRF